MTRRRLGRRTLNRLVFGRDGTVRNLGPISIVRKRELADLVGRLKKAENFTLPGRTVPYPALARQTRRSVVFLGNSYYNFFYLSAALRRRGWDAISVSLEDPSGPNAKFYHGDDLNLFDPDPERFDSNIEEFYAEVAARFEMVHFYGAGHMTFFPNRADYAPNFTNLPFDFLELRRLGIKIGYSVNGCLDGVAQSSVNRWSGGVCDRCVWQEQASVCSDRGNLAWGHKVYMFCDLVATEGFPALDWQASDKTFREPLTSALDAGFWHRNLEIPDRLRLPRAPGELIVYHGVGNFDLRNRDGRNVKGTGAVVAAIDRLRAEGVNVRLEFVSDMPNRDVRFIQAQADVVVDQLNYGRYGATAREAMMLGRPTICHINRDEASSKDCLKSIETCPLVPANEATIYDILRSLLSNEERRRAIGIASRAYAMKWHSSDACAERFEAVFDRLRLGLPPVVDDAVAAGAGTAK